MTDTDYNAVLSDALTQLEMLRQKAREIEVDISKLTQFIYAAMNMVPDDQRVDFIAKLDELAFDEDIRSVGLKDAITRILAAHPEKWFTSVEVRDDLLASRFNFTAYKANPLASVSTTLKRIKPEEAETTTIDGVTAYRWKKKPSQMRKERLQRLREETAWLPSQMK
jgi:hypothetical protein